MGNIQTKIPPTTPMANILTGISKHLTGIIILPRTRMVLTILSMLSMDNRLDIALQITPIGSGATQGTILRCITDTITRTATAVPARITMAMATVWAARIIGFSSKALKLILYSLKYETSATG